MGQGVFVIFRHGTKHNKSWINELEEPKTVVQRGIYEPKFMFCLFFRTSGPVLVNMVEKGMTIYN